MPGGSSHGIWPPSGHHRLSSPHKPTHLPGVSPQWALSCTCPWADGMVPSSIPDAALNKATGESVLCARCGPSRIPDKLQARHGQPQVTLHRLPKFSRQFRGKDGIPAQRRQKPAPIRLAVPPAARGGSLGTAWSAGHPCRSSGFGGENLTVPTSHTSRF